VTPADHFYCYAHLSPTYLFTCSTLRYHDQRPSPSPVLYLRGRAANMVLNALRLPCRRNTASGLRLSSLWFTGDDRTSFTGLTFISPPSLCPYYLLLMASYCGTASSTPMCASLLCEHCAFLPSFMVVPLLCACSTFMAYAVCCAASPCANSPACFCHRLCSCLYLMPHTAHAFLTCRRCLPAPFYSIAACRLSCSGCFYRMGTGGLVILPGRGCGTAFCVT